MGMKVRSGPDGVRDAYWPRRRTESRTIFTQSSTTPIVAPTTTTARGVTNAICSSVNFVTAAPTSQIASTATVMSPQSHALCTPRA
jgi:hypothetical protein